MKSKIDWIVVLSCLLVMMCEGFDLVVYGSTIPLLIKDETIGLSTGGAGNIGSLVFLGMLIGGLVAGRVNQAFTSRKIILVGTAAFSIAVLITGLATEVWSIALLRFVTGLGLGVVLPTALSLARSVSGQRHAPLAISVTMAGIPVGGTFATLTVAMMGDGANWRIAFVIAGVVGLTAMLLSLRGLRHDNANIVKKANKNQESWSEIFSGSRRWLLVFFALSTFAYLFSYYGVTTWLTQLMQEFDLPMKNSLQLTAALNIGAIIGSLATSLIAVKLGAKVVALSCGVLAACCLTGISLHPESSLVLGALVVMAGATAISAQNLLNTLVSDSFPSHLRSSALGFTLGFGRLGAVCAPAVGGYVLEFGLGPEAVLACFACASLVGCITLYSALVKTKKDSSMAAEKTFVVKKIESDET